MKESSENYLQRLRKIREKYECLADTQGICQPIYYKEVHSRVQKQSPSCKRNTQKSLFMCNPNEDSINYKLERIKQIQWMEKHHGIKSKRLNTEVHDENFAARRSSCHRNNLDIKTGILQNSNYTRLNCKFNTDQNYTPSKFNSKKIGGNVCQQPQIPKEIFRSRENILYETPSKIRADLNQFEKTTRICKSAGLVQHYQEEYKTINNAAKQFHRNSRDFKLPLNHDAFISTNLWQNSIKTGVSQERKRHPPSTSVQKVANLDIKTIRNHMNASAGTWSIENFDRVQKKIHSVLNKNN